jgi:hypothetical protein
MTKVSISVARVFNDSEVIGPVFSEPSEMLIFDQI